MARSRAAAEPAVADVRADFAAYPEPNLTGQKSVFTADANRRAALFDRIHALGGQAFMTGTDRAMFSALGDRAQYFTVKDASVAEEAP